MPLIRRKSGRQMQPQLQWRVKEPPHTELQQLQPPRPLQPPQLCSPKDDG